MPIKHFLNSIQLRKINGAKEGKKQTLTIEACECPVPACICRPLGQFEGEGAGARGQIGVTSSDVDGVGLRLLTHLHLRREDMRSIVIYVQQVHL